MSQQSIVNTPTYYLLIIIACTLWGSAFAGAKIGFLYCPPIILSGLRFTLAGLILIPALLYKKESISNIVEHWKFLFLFGFMQTFLKYGVYFLGLNELPGAVAAIIVGSAPVITMVIAHFMVSDDRFTTRKTIAALLGFSGIIFIASMKEAVQVSTQSLYIGASLLLLSNVIGAISNIVVSKKKTKKISPFTLAACSNLTGGLMLLTTGAIFEQVPIGPLPLEFYLSLLWLAIIPAASFSIWYYLLNQDGVKVSELNIWKFIIPIIGALLSWLLVKGESPKWQEAVGLIIVSFAVLVLQYRPKSKQ